MGNGEISTKKQLLQELGIASFAELTNNAEAVEAFQKVLPRIVPDLLALVINTVPEVRRMVIGLCDAAATVSRSLSEVQKERWRTLRAIVETGQMTSDQIMELATMITETERTEGRNWTEILKKAGKIAGTVAAAVGVLVAAIIIFGLGGGKRQA